VPDLGAAVITVAVAAIIRLALVPLLGTEAPLLLFGAMAAAVTFWGGLGPGILATALGTTVGTLLFIKPVEQLARGHLAMPLEPTLFFGETMFVCWLIYRVRAGQESSEARQQRRDDSLAFVAHELRHPLSTIQLAAATLQRDRSPEATDRAAMLITRSAARLARVVDDLVDVTRLQRASLSVSLQRIDLREPLLAALEVARPSFAQRHQSIEAAVPTATLPVNGDAIRLQQVFSNLLSNASKYSPEGSEVRIAVNCGRGRVDVVVRDSGLGIKDDMLERIFEPFVRESGGGTTDGLGVGLTLARTLVEQHGGQISAHSDGPGRGSEFRVMLPVLDEMPQAHVTTH